MPFIEFNVTALDKATGQPITAPIVILISPGLSGEVRNGNPANFYNGPPLAAPWIGDVTVLAAGYAPWSTGANPQVTFKDSTVNLQVPLESFKRPFTPAPRVWVANMCGIRIAGLPVVAGGGWDPTLFLSWFYHLYDAPTRAVIRAAMRAKGYTHWLLSWPDAQDAGVTPQGFLALCRELISAGFFPCPMLSAKPTSSARIMTIEQTLANILLVLPLLIGTIPLASIGWELSLWMSPSDLQFLIDQIAPMLTSSGCRLYVHLQEGYPSFQQAGGTVADFWWPQQGKLTGILLQRKLTQDKPAFRDWINDCLLRFCGGFNMPDDSGFGHPFDPVMLEITASNQFNDGMSEAEGDTWGTWAMDSPARTGPHGAAVGIMGSGNGQTR
jgi:hypothetical protein